MALFRRLSLAVAALAASTGLTACSSSESAVVNVVTIGEADDPFEQGIHLSLAGQISRASTNEGLVAFDAEGRVVPALADRWIVTDDGKSYIFRLRDGTWRDGSELTGGSARRALRNVLRALRGTSLGRDLSMIVEVREMAGRVIEIRLSRPAPHFLQLLAQPELGLANGETSAGPMDIRREGEVALLTPINPADLGLPAVRRWDERVRTVRLTTLPANEAVEQFNQTEVDLVLGGKIKDFPYTGSVGILRGTIQLDPVIGLFGLRVRHTKGFLSEPANREAIAMAIDRKALLAPFAVGGWIPSDRVVASGLEGDLGTIGQRWSEMSIEDRKAQAATRVARWKEAQESGKPLHLRIAMDQGPGATMLFSSLAKDMTDIGIEAELVAPAEQSDLVLVDTVARYPDALWFLNRLSCGVSKLPCDKTAEERLKEADRADTVAERAALLAEAEAELTKSNLYIPFGPPIRWSLVRGDLRGFETNAWAWHPLMPMALLPR